MKKLEKIAKKYNLALEDVLQIIATEHMINKFYKKSELKSININLSDRHAKWLKKIAKALKVSESAIVVVGLENYLKIHSSESKLNAR